MLYLRIVGQYALVLAIALTLNFALPRIAPGSPLNYMLGEDVLSSMSDTDKAAVLAEFGLDQPLPVQFARYVAGIFQGDLGISVRFGMPVWDVVVARLPWTLLLMGWSLAISTVLGTLLGVLSARFRGQRFDVVSLAGVLFVGSIPPFWLAMILVTVFSAELGWLPSFGAEPLIARSGSLDYYLGVAARLVMPVTALATVQTATLLLTARSAMSMALDQDYITFARAKGVPERRIFAVHALRNALLPIYTNVMVSVGALIGGTIVIETVFNYPGLGSLIIEGVGARDYNLLQGVFLFAAVSVIAANFVADLGYPLIDPRVRRA